MGGETRRFRQSASHPCSGLDNHNVNINEHLRLNHCLYASNNNLSTSMSMPAIDDSGSSGHYACISSPCTHTRPAGNNSITITFPNGDQASSTHIGLLPNENLPLKARIVCLFPQMKDKFLMSLGQLCDADMTVTLTKHKLCVYNDDNFDTIIVEGTRNAPDGMWHLDLVPKPKTQNPK